MCRRCSRPTANVNRTAAIGLDEISFARLGKENTVPQQAGGLLQHSQRRFIQRRQREKPSGDAVAAAKPRQALFTHSTWCARPAADTDQPRPVGSGRAAHQIALSTLRRPSGCWFCTAPDTGHTQVGISGRMRRTVLAGPEGHPFHAFVVPLPIGAFVSSLIFDILTLTRDGGLPYLVDGAFWLIGIGLIGALIAAVFGLLDLVAIPRRTPPFATGITHLILNAAAAMLFVAGYVWRSADHVELDQTRWGQFALSAAAVALLIAAVWLGQKLTYHYGRRVTPSSEQAKGGESSGA